ncbi:exosortase A [Quisquiliibacterium transsilvanicum]|uniref:Exosortase A n=1 Tax=Quisquiliibacterium transsilvanicum TaxID=1549638 RepID=A0A7W8M6Z3_9BURK|nr:exosortase A [Quisquiliibacterium transsilvanicum]MBB5270042.1 exosortase A [Quisquiliibacterium transsilvanicum]
MSSLPLPARPDASMSGAAALALLAALLALMGFAFGDTLRAMVQVWNTENYQHGYLIVPMALWLAWHNRREVLAQPLAPFWPAAIPLMLACAAWMLGRLAGVNVVEQFALVGMLPSALALVFGWRLVWSLAYPLAFLLFAVPFGEGLYPVMMERTADFTVAAVRLSGVPVARDGLFFELPSGRWSVVEACSGLRYLLAALPLSAVYAYLSWHSWLLRALFIAMTVVVAVVANWLRAYLIVMLGHLSGMKLAVGVDHLIYGWVFFGIVMAIVFWIGSRWKDRAAAPDMTAAAAARSTGPAALALGLVLAAGIIGGAVAGTGTLQDQGESTVKLAPLAALIAREAQPPPAEAYRPVYDGGVGHLEGRVVHDLGVGMMVTHYVRQHRHGEMITYENGMNPGRVDSGQAWRITARSTREPAALGTGFPVGPVNEYRLASPAGAVLAWEWFWLNGRVLADPRRVKIHTALDLLRGRGDESLAFVAWVPIEGSLDDTRARLAKAVQGLQAGATAAGL